MDASTLAGFKSAPDTFPERFDDCFTRRDTRARVAPTHRRDIDLIREVGGTPSGGAVKSDGSVQPAGDTLETVRQRAQK